MYLMEGRKLLDAQVFNGRQKLLKLSLQFFFLWVFENFFLKLLYMLGVVQQVSDSAAKLTANLTRRKSWRL